MQDTHHVAKSTHSREYKLISRQYVLNLCNNVDRIAYAFNGIYNAADVTGTVIQQGNHSRFQPPGIKLNKADSYNTTDNNTSL